MFKNVLAYGNKQISSGSTGTNAIKTLNLTMAVNDREDIAIGTACCAVLETVIIAKGGNLSIADGTAIKLLHEYDNGKSYQDGVFYSTQPVQKSANSYKITAYDAVSRLDKDLTEWLAGLTGWPYTVTRFAQKVCEACGLTLANDPPHNSGYLVQKFVASNITGRQLMKWCAEIGGAFVKANWKGEIIFDWYKSYSKEFSPDGIYPYRSGSLHYADFSASIIDAVRIKLTEDDLGVIFPPDGNPQNIYNVTANYLLTTDKPETLAPVAESLYNVLKDISYVPCKFKTDSIRAVEGGGLMPGAIVSVTDRNGKKFQSYITKTVRSGFTLALESTGNKSRNSVPAVNDVSLGVLNHKMFELRKSVSGFDARISEVSTSNKETIKKVNELSATVDGYNSRISAAEQSSKQAVDKVNELSVTVDGFNSRITSAETKSDSATKKVNELSATVDGFSSRISSVETSNKSTVEKVSKVEQTVNSVSASVGKKVDADSGTWATFGWELFSDRWEIRANNKVLLKVTKATGLEIDGKVTARSGKIGNITIKEYTSSNNRGGYLKVEGVAGSKTATYIGSPNASLFGKYVILSGPDNDVEDQYTFRLSAKGELYSTAGKIGGWDIGADSLSTLGATWNLAPAGGIYIGPAGINLSENFFVSKNGNLTAKNGRFYGTVWAGKIDYGSSAGYVSGKCLSTNSVTTTETSTGINSSLGYANFSDDVFNDRATAQVMKALSVSTKNFFYRGNKVQPSTLSVRGADGKTYTLNYLEWVPTP